MYQIKCDDYVLHDVTIEGLQVISPKCELELNKTGSLTFSITPLHPHYDKIKKHTSEITLYQDNKILFSGRVLNDEVDFDNIKNVECEGELSYLLDSIQRAKKYQLDGGSANVIETYLKDIISIHNSQVDDRKKFNVGLVTVADPNNYLYKISNYENTLSVITDKLLNTYGGYLFVRHDGDGRFIDYVTDLNGVCGQKIEFGKNIVDMTKYIKGEDIYTALIPLGAKTDVMQVDENDIVEERLTIHSLPDSTDGTIKKVNDYIYDTEAVESWGWLWKVIKWDDVTVAENLLRKGKESLISSVDATLSLELTAIDLHLLDVDVDRINVGDRIQCISLPHNLNTVLIVKSMSINIDDPSKTTIKLTSYSKSLIQESSISSGNKDNEKNIVNVQETLRDGYPTIDDMNYMFEGVRQDLSLYATIVEVNSAFSQLANALREV